MNIVSNIIIPAINIKTSICSLAGLLVILKYERNIRESAIIL